MLKSKTGYNVLTVLVIAIVAIFLFYWIGQKGGFHEDEIKKILGGNWLRVSRETWPNS